MCCVYREPVYTTKYTKYYLYTVNFIQGGGGFQNSQVLHSLSKDIDI